MNVESRHADLRIWKEVVRKALEPKRRVRIGVVGKYMDLHDAYKSIWEALCHGGIANDAGVEIVRIDSSRFEAPDADHGSILKGVDGMLIPGGFGQRGINGMVSAARWARENKLPCFGICLGMQIMAIEWGRTVLGWEDADSAEFNQDTSHPVVSLLEDQVDVKNFGGTMRLGRNDTQFKEGSRPAMAYGATLVSERHRHRYEFSNTCRADYEKSGMIIAGLTPDGELVESLEWPDHPWGVGVQFHPEFKSRPVAPHPLFAAFVKASVEYGRKRG
jgi:CTP synthase